MEHQLTSDDGKNQKRIVLSSFLKKKNNYIIYVPLHIGHWRSFGYNWWGLISGPWLRSVLRVVLRSLCLVFCIFKGWWLGKLEFCLFEKEFSVWFSVNFERMIFVFQVTSYSSSTYPSRSPKAPIGYTKFSISYQLG